MQFYSICKDDIREFAVRQLGTTKPAHIFKFCSIGDNEKQPFSISESYEEHFQVSNPSFIYCDFQTNNCLHYMSLPTQLLHQEEAKAWRITWHCMYHIS